MARYLDSGSNNPSQTVGYWLDQNLVPGIRGFRCQDGYFRFDAIRPFADIIRDAALAGFHVRMVFGSNDGSLLAQDVQRALRVASGRNASVIVVAYDDVEFHPKTIHIIKSDDSTAAAVGSSNLTASGLGRNVEASITLNSGEDGVRELDQVAAAVDRWLGMTEDNGVFRVESDDDVQALVNRRIINLPQPTRRRRRQTTGPSTERLPSRGRTWQPSRPGWLPDISQLIPPPADDACEPEPEVQSPPPAPAPPPQATPSTATTTTPMAPAASVPSGQFQLTWRSRGLTRRDLTIPNAAGTHATGSMLWKQGDSTIDQRHWFRDVAFAGLSWLSDLQKPHLERSRARFHFTVLGAPSGTFDLKLSHKTDTTSRSYAQKNSMTQVHWGAARAIIAREDLIGRSMSLYRKEGNPPEFRIVIE
jgi:hypothetical protein